MLEYLENLKEARPELVRYSLYAVGSTLFLASAFSFSLFYRLLTCDKNQYKMNRQAILNRRKTTLSDILLTSDNSESVRINSKGELTSTAVNSVFRTTK